MPRTIEDVNQLMMSGDAANGMRLLVDIARLAHTTEQFSYQSKVMTPSDARDLLTFFASQGISLIAEKVEPAQ